MLKLASTRTRGHMRRHWSTADAGLNLFIPNSGLIQYLKRGGSGSTWTDASGNGLHASLVNAAWSGRAVAFDGSGDYASTAYNSTYLAFNGTKNITISAWLNWTSSTDDYNAIFSNESVSGGITLLLKSNQKLAVYFSGTGTFSMDGSGSSVPFSTWTLVTMTYDGSNIKTYINDTLNSTTSGTGNYLNPGAAWQVGGSQPYGRYFNGSMSDFIVYDRAITLAEVQLIYGLGSPS